MRVLVFGASSVQGFWDTQGGWADRLKSHYQQAQVEDFNQGRITDLPKVMNLGISGDGTKELLARMDIEAGARQNAKGLVIVVSIGSNNAAILNGRAVSTPEEYGQDLQKIIDTAHKYTDKLLIVGFPMVDESKTTPIPWADMHYRNENILTIENKAAEVAAKNNVLFVPILDKFRQLGGNLQSHDGLHPNDEGHKLIFELVRPALDDLLNT